MSKLKVILFTVSACLLLVFGIIAASSMNLLSASQSGTNTDSDTSTVTDDDSTETPDDDQGTIDITDPSGAVQIKLNGDFITVSPSNGATVASSTVTITSAGTYRISGSLTDGQIVVNTNDKEVTLILDGVNVHCSNNSPIYVESAKDVYIILEENTNNYVSDGAAYVLATGESEPNAAIFSKSDLKISGDGSLTVDANYNDGIASKDELKIEDCTITVTSVDDGIRGKDSIEIEDATLTLDVGGDGLKSDNEEDASRGYIGVESGTISITSQGDAIQAETNIVIVDGEFTLTTGGGSNSVISTSDSAKGIKANSSITINGGSFAINAADDAVNANGNITINGGNFTISTGDDGIHADTSLTVNGGDINIAESYEGMESAIVTVNEGDIHIASSDDGINVVGGNDASGMNQGPGFGGGGFPGQDQFTYSSEYYLQINGGYIYIDAYGDGIDINGKVEMTAGYLIINGPTSNANGAVDTGTFTITGGYLVAVGSSGMAQAPGASSVQESVLLNFGSTIQAGTLINIQSTSGEQIVSFVSTKQYSSMALSTPTLTAGTTYNVYGGGSSTGTVKDGIYTGGTYTPGTLYGSFTA